MRPTVVQLVVYKTTDVKHLPCQIIISNGLMMCAYVPIHIIISIFEEHLQLSGSILIILIALQNTNIIGMYDNCLLVLSAVDLVK